MSEQIAQGKKPEAQRKKLMPFGLLVICLVAAGMSLWLTVQKWSGAIDSLAGCGSGSGCSNVLGSKWSVVFGTIPVSVFSSFLYLAVIISLGWCGARARLFRILAAWLLLWAAIWFTGLQFFVLQSFCPYCMTMHGLGVVIGIGLLLSERNRGRGRSSWLAALVAAGLVLALAGIQSLGPEPDKHRVDAISSADFDADDGAATGVHAAGDGRLVTFFGGKKSYRLSSLPLLGSADAEHVIVKYFDYTCDACREVDAYLLDAIARHPDQLAVLVLPVPLSRDCNPHLPEGLPDHARACELARLSLRVWRSDRSQFGAFHHQLFELKEVPVEMAESLASGMVGESKLVEDGDAWVESLLQANVSDYREFVRQTPVLPKLLLTDSVMIQGLIKDQETLDRLLSEHLGID